MINVIIGAAWMAIALITARFIYLVIEAWVERKIWDHSSMDLCRARHQEIVAVIHEINKSIDNIKNEQRKRALNGKRK